MTLSEAIIHAEEVAYQKDLESEFETDNERYAMTDNERANCKKCADEHRQLAEWLKELKAYKEQSGDAIYRQAAIDAIDVLCQEHRYKIPGKRETYGQYNEAWQDALDRAEGAIFNLPTVQPDHVAESNKKDEQPAEIAQNVQNGDLIQREAAIEALARMMPRSYTPDGSHPADEEIFRAQEVFVDCIEALEILPSAQLERKKGAWINEGRMIRCNKCKIGYATVKGMKSALTYNFCPNCGADMRGEE